MNLCVLRVFCGEKAAAVNRRDAKDAEEVIQGFKARMRVESG